MAKEVPQPVQDPIEQIRDDQAAAAAKVRELIGRMADGEPIDAKHLEKARTTAGLNIEDLESLKAEFVERRRLEAIVATKEELSSEKKQLLGELGELRLAFEKWEKQTEQKKDELRHGLREHTGRIDDVRMRLLEVVDAEVKLAALERRSTIRNLGAAVSANPGQDALAASLPQPAGPKFDPRHPIATMKH
jgi:hypothetical protein